MRFFYIMEEIEAFIRRKNEGIVKANFCQRWTNV